jgi:hypothetical protein
MAVYIWKGRTRQGNIKKGEIEAMNEAAVMAQLRAQLILPVSVKEKAKDISEYLPFLKPGIKTKELVIFTRQFATMIDAGLPLVQCLQILADQNDNRTFKEILRETRADVEQGSTFADALAKHPKPFDPLYVNLVAAGEIGGILDTILNRLAVYLEKADALARKVKGAMVYPATVLIVAIGVVVLLLTKVIPTFEKMFEDFRSDCPGGGDRELQYGAPTEPALPSADRRALPQVPGLRFAAAKGGRGAVHADARHDDREWCSDPRRPRHRREDGRQRGDRRGALRRQGGDHGRKDLGGAALGIQRLPGHGGPDDRRG